MPLIVVPVETEFKIFCGNVSIYQNRPSIRNAIILCGTNNIQYDTTEDIVDGILEIAITLRSKYHLINVAICGLIPRDDIWSINRIYINKINNDLLYKWFYFY